MSKSTVNIEELEAALLARAKTLAGEYMAHAQRNRDQAIADANERLRLREEREILAAKASAERNYRQRVQASEIKQQEEFDRLRWSLVRAVLDRLPQLLTKVTADDKQYLPLLRKYLAQAAEAIERDELVAEVNQRDHLRLSKNWDGFCRNAGVRKHIVLAPKPIPGIGGIRLSSADNTIRVDNTFEGRLERLEEDLQQVVLERLFVSATPLGVMFGG
ncbi:MAG: V-type ATP synthase subunit E [Sulfuricaulis sp.]